MKQMATLVQCVSTLYANMIEKTIHPGFDMVSTASYGVGRSSTMILAQDQQRRTLYLQGAEAQCSRLSVDVRLTSLMFDL